MTLTRALAYIRQLCRLGLGMESVIAEFLQAAQWAIPTESNAFIR
jgi:hypothetical protein